MWAMLVYVRASALVYVGESFGFVFVFVSVSTVLLCINTDCPEMVGERQYSACEGKEPGATKL